MSNDLLKDQPDDDCPVDVFMYLGQVMPPSDADLYRRIRSRPKGAQARRAELYLSTVGGIAGVGYRVMRALQHAYDNRVTVVLFDACKSAGTLMVLGADRVVMLGEAELGPLDVQIREQDEVHNRRSGLAPQVAFKALAPMAWESFQTFFNKLVDVDINMSTGTASSTATELTIGLFSPVYAQIDPLRIADYSRMNTEGRDYGVRLIANSRNATMASIQQLLFGYPSHGFVIDRKEACYIFNSVFRANDRQRAIIAEIRTMDWSPYRAEPIIEMRPASDGPHANPSSDPDADGSSEESTDDSGDEAVPDGGVSGVRGAADEGAVPEDRGPDGGGGEADSGGAADEGVAGQKPRSRKKTPRAE